MGHTRSVDDLIVRVENEHLSADTAQPQPAPEPEHAPEPVAAAPEPEVADPKDDYLPEESVPEAAEAKEEASAEDDGPAGDPVVAGPVDEYGNPVEKQKTYTEEEVQRMIRDRLSRGRHAEQPTQQQVQQATEDFKADPNSEDSWEVQLEQFIDKTIEKRQAKQSEVQWRQQEAAKQAEFESKFSTGMSKYQDFHQVVQGKPITDAMMLATRDLENPAAFVYAASKLHASELTRIAQIPDARTQAMEIGRLHERMIKNRRSVSAAPKPVAPVKGDMPVKQHEHPSIDHRIQQHAKQKFARR